MPPTPQHSHQYSHMAPQASPQQVSSSQPNGLQSYGNHGYNLSFDSSQQSLSQPLPTGFSQSFPNGPVSNPGYARSFGEGASMKGMRGYNEPAQIYTVSSPCAESIDLYHARSANINTGRLLWRVCLRNGSRRRRCHAPPKRWLAQCDTNPESRRR